MSTNASREAWEIIFRMLIDGELQTRMHSACTFAGVAPGVLKTLIHLESETPTSMRDLAQHFGVDASYVTSLVDDLETAGLAERCPHPTDRRAKMIVLTPRGVEIQRRVQELMYQPPVCFNGLSASELKQLRDLLAKAVAAETVAGAPRA